MYVWAIWGTQNLSDSQILMSPLLSPICFTLKKAVIYHWNLGYYRNLMIEANAWGVAMFCLWQPPDSWERLQEIRVFPELACNGKEKKNLKLCPLLKFINFTGSMCEGNTGVKLDNAVWTCSNAATNEQSTEHSNSKAKRKSCSLLLQWTGTREKK